jgi:hypothetical protein
MGTVVAVCISILGSGPRVDVKRGELRAGYGLIGDGLAGHAVGFWADYPVSLLSLALIERANRQFGLDAQPGTFGEHLTIEGIDLRACHVGDHLYVGKALLKVGRMDRTDVYAHTYSYHGLALLTISGVFCQVLESGMVETGDSVRRVRS